MGLLYFNIINTIIKSKSYNKCLFFSFPDNTNFDGLYYIQFDDLFKLLGVKEEITFISPSCNYINSFNISIDGGYVRNIETINLLSESKRLLQYCDNKDFPFYNKNRMKHSPFIIYNNVSIKFPTSRILTVDSSYKIHNFEKLKDYKHCNYNLITEYIKEIRTFKELKDISYSFKNFKKYLDNGNAEEEKRIFTRLCRK
jgi:hypothetical protein